MALRQEQIDAMFARAFAPVVQGAQMRFSLAKEQADRETAAAAEEDRRRAAYQQQVDFFGLQQAALDERDTKHNKSARAAERRSNERADYELGVKLAIDQQRLAADARGRRETHKQQVKLYEEQQRIAEEREGRRNTREDEIARENANVFLGYQGQADTAMAEYEQASRLNAQEVAALAVAAATEAGLDKAAIKQIKADPRNLSSYPEAMRVYAARMDEEVKLKQGGPAATRALMKVGQAQRAMALLGRSPLSFDRNMLDAMTMPESSGQPGEQDLLALALEMGGEPGSETTVVPEAPPEVFNPEGVTVRDVAGSPVFMGPGGMINPMAVGNVGTGMSPAAASRLAVTADPMQWLGAAGSSALSLNERAQLPIINAGMRGLASASDFFAGPTEFSSRLRQPVRGLTPMMHAALQRRADQRAMGVADQRALEVFAPEQAAVAADDFRGSDQEQFFGQMPAWLRDSAAMTWARDALAEPRR